MFFEVYGYHLALHGRPHSFPTRRSSNLNAGDTPGGLANSSGQLGRNLTESTGASFRAFVPALAGRPRYNEDGIGGQHIYIPFWLYQEQQRGDLDFPRGYHFEIGGRFSIPPAAALPRVWGAGLKTAVRSASGATIGMTLRGEMIPNQEIGRAH